MTVAGYQAIYARTSGFVVGRWLHYISIRHFVLDAVSITTKEHES